MRENSPIDIAIALSKRLKQIKLAKYTNTDQCLGLATYLGLANDFIQNNQIPEEICLDIEQSIQILSDVVGVRMQNLIKDQFIHGVVTA